MFATEWESLQGVFATEDSEGTEGERRISMIYGDLHAPDGYQVLLASCDAWRRAFDWLRHMPPDPEPGIRKLLGDDMYVNIHGYDTLPVADCRFESHRRYVDLQYCIRGGERIDWELATRLTPEGPFDAERDVQWYQPAEAGTTVHLLPGRFAIFHPNDAHRPKRADGLHPAVFKLVIKVAHRLVAGG